jgi:hypothetical protein
MVSMISHKTVLILGAGASRPYLFPTGGELRDLLLQRSYDSILRSLDLSGPDQQPYGDWYRELLSNHIRQEQIEDFQRRFAESEFFSIDRFLAFNPEFDDTGRFMIAAILLNCERTPHLKGDWYQILFNELTTEGSDIPADFLSVITFNYDRSLEWYVFRSFRAAFHLSDDEARERVQQIKIVHVYGDLGPLLANRSERVEFGAWRRAAAAAKSIKLVRPNAQSDFIADINRLGPPVRVVFLGFAFDPMNLDAIGMTENRGYTIFASRRDLPMRRMDYVTRKLNRMEWGSPNSNISDFLNESLALS